MNEPCFYSGVTPDRYAAMLAAAHRSIKRANPTARLVIGDPVAGCGSTRWLERVLELAPRSFDIANLHLRGTLRGVATGLRRWRRVYARHGRGRAPLWVTEFGYPSTDECQTDRDYRGGERAQARYLRDGLDVLTALGAAQVLVTLRDNLDGCWLSEGIAAIGGQPPYRSRRKPALSALRRWRPLARLCALRAGQCLSPAGGGSLGRRCRRVHEAAGASCCHPKTRPTPR